MQTPHCHALGVKMYVRSSQPPEEQPQGWKPVCGIIARDSEVSISLNFFTVGTYLPAPSLDSKRQVKKKNKKTPPIQDRIN